MQTDKAKEYNSYLKRTIEHLKEFHFSTAFNNYSSEQIEQIKGIYNIEELNKKRDSFKEEVVANIIEYKEKKLLMSIYSLHSATGLDGKVLIMIIIKIS